MTDPAFFPFCCGVGTAGKTRSETKQTVFALSIRYNQTEKWFLFCRKDCKKRGLEVVYCPFPLKSRSSVSASLYISPEEWLWYMQNADYVVTDAFHGTVFSILFNRPFVVEISEYGKDTGSRITNILDIYSLQDRLMVKGDCIEQTPQLILKKLTGKLRKKFNLENRN